MGIFAIPVGGSYQHTECSALTVGGYHHRGVGSGAEQCQHDKNDETELHGILRTVDASISFVTDEVWLKGNDHYSLSSAI
jgi:hypothetical protein